MTAVLAAASLSVLAWGFACLLLAGLVFVVFLALRGLR